MTTFDKWLRGIGLGGLFLVPFIPLYISSSMFFPFITGKNFAFRIIVLIIALATALLLLRRPEYRPKSSPVLVTLTSLVVVIGLADLFGVYPYRSFWSNYERMEGYIGVLHLFAYFLVAITLLNKERLWGWLLNTSLFVSILLSIYGFFQMNGMFVSGQGGARLDATFGNATYFAIYASLHAFFAIFFFLRSNGRMSQCYYGLLAILNVIMLYHTATRGAILGFIIGAFVTLCLIAVKQTGRIRNVSIGIIVAILAIVSVFVMARNSTFVKQSPVLSRFGSISLKDTTTASRFTIWGMAYEGWKEHPVLGWGQENFNLVFNKYYKTELWPQESWFDRAHNIYVEWFIVGGLLGGIAYLLIFVTLFFVVWGKRGVKGTTMFSKWNVNEKAILTGAVVAYMVNNFFVFDNLVSSILFFGFLAAVHIGSVEAREPVGSSKVGNTDTMSLAGQCLLVVLAVFLFWRADIRPVRASHLLIKAMSPQQGGPAENLKYFKEALALNTFADPEIREQLVRFATQVRGATEAQVGNNLKTEILGYAEEEMRKQVAITPNDARYQLFLGNYELTLGRLDDAEVALKKAVELSPGKQQMYTALTAVYINKGDNLRSLETAKYSYELDKSNEEALVNYAVTAIFAKNSELADSLIEKLSSKDRVATDQRFFQAYYVTKQYAKIASIWEVRIAKNPTNAQSYTSLAAAYLMIGRRSDAIKAIEKAISLEPKFKDQGNALIGDIRAGKNPVSQ